METYKCIPLGSIGKISGKPYTSSDRSTEMLQSGITIEACQDCCNNFGVTSIIINLGITVRYMGAPLTECLKNGEKILSI